MELATLHGRLPMSQLLTILTAAALLALLGISGIARGDELLGSGQEASRQTLWLGIALVCGGGMALVPYRRLKAVSFPAYFAVILLLVLVYLFPARNGARRWIPLGPVLVQPSELAKLAYILALGHYLMFRKNQRTLLGLVPPFLMTAAPVLLILKEPDLGTSLLFFPVLFAMLFAAGARRRHLAAACLGGLLILPVLWTAMNAEQRSRVTAVLRQRDSGEPETGDGYHLYQAKLMLALGGPSGSARAGMPLSDPAAYRLPAGRTDFVYCLVGEKWGLAGTLGTLAFFGVLVLTGLRVAGRTRDPFGRLVATGISSMFATQVLINTAMTVGLAPITGLTLPLMSYGGSSLVATACSLGVLANLSVDPGYDLAGQPFQFSDQPA